MEDFDDIKDTIPSADAAEKDRKRKRKIFLAVTLIIGVVFPALLFTVSGIYGGGRNYMGVMFIVIAVFFLIAGGIMLIVFLTPREELKAGCSEVKPPPRKIAFPKIGFPIAALTLSSLAMVFYTIVASLNFAVFLVFFSPFVAIVLLTGMIIAVVSLCMKREKIGRQGTIMAIISLVLPVVAAVVSVILFSTGVAVIRFM